MSSAVTPEIESELEALNSKFSERDFDELEHRLKLNAACRGWTGDPMKQPPETVLQIARAVLRDRPAT